MAQHKILIIGPAWVGDMVMAQVLFKILKAQNQPEIHVLAPDWTIPLLQRMPEIDRAIGMSTQHGKLSLGLRYQQAKQLKAEEYDQAILMTNSWKSGLVPFLARIPVRTGWLGEFRYGLVNDIKLMDKSIYPLMIQRFAMLAYPKHEKLPEQLPYPQLVFSTENQQALRKKFQLEEHKSLLVLAPGAEYGPAKRWPAHYFAEVAQEKINQGWQVVVLGSPKDKQISEAITGVCPDVTDLIGKTKLTDAIDLMAMASSVISNDSGLMHIAAALDIPMVAIYGSSAPTFTPPLSDQAKIVSLHLSCSPCFKRECPLGHMDCLNQLKPDTILQALDNRLSI